MDGERKHSAALKELMLKSSKKSDINLYDHLTRVLMKVLDERPPDMVDVFECMSRDVKRGYFEDKQIQLQERPHFTAAELLAEQQSALFSASGTEQQDSELMSAALPNVTEMGFYLEQAGVSLDREEMQRIFLALRQLVESKSPVRCRLWGKILGTESNYFVAEADFGEDEEDEEQLIDEIPEGEERESDSQENELDALPQSIYKPPPAVPKEASGTGCNRFVYYVCTEPGLPWVRLPPVTPAQITVARQIRRFFTGVLDKPVVSYPPFPGNETNYLRAQIARISAGTHASPQGFFLTGDEEGDDEDGPPADNLEVNPNFESVPAGELVESLSNWVHHVQHILQQGRCTWVNLAVKQRDESNEEGDSDEADEEPDGPEPEAGPPLFTPLSQDAEMFDTPPWSTRLSSTLTSQHAVAVLRSNLWPGAYAYACGKKFENIYIGWGLKYLNEVYSPPVPPPPQQAYPMGAEITEDQDPSLEEEQALEEALEEQEAAEEEEQESEEDDEDDD